MRSIYFIRHCKYYNPNNIIPGRLAVELSQEGIKQANKLKQYFKDKNIEKIYSSKVYRCQQTSEIIADDKINIEYDQRLLELFSATQGGPMITDTRKLGEYVYKNNLGGETLVEIQNRMISCYKDIVKKKENNIIICSHGDPLYLLYLHLYKKTAISEEELFNLLVTRADGKIKYPEKGSILQVDIENGGVKTIRPLMEL